MTIKHIINKIISFFDLTKDDPLYHCDLYKDKGCSHVDGFLCDYPKCCINIDYLDELKIK